MSIQRWGFESGSNGDIVNATNSSSDYLISTGGTAIISTTQKAHGTRSALFTSTSTSGAVYIQKAITATTNLGVDAYIYVTSLTDAESSFLWIGSGTTRYVSLSFMPSGQIRIRDRNFAISWTSSTTIALNTWTRISIVATQGATAGTARAAFYGMDSTAATEDSGWLTAKNTGENPYTSIRIGPKASTGTNQCVAYFDDWAYDTEAVALLPPYGAVPPTLGTPVVTYDKAYIDMSSSSFAFGPGIYSATPSSGVQATSGGVVVPRDPDGDTTTYVVTATDATTGASASVSVAVDGVSPFIKGQSESVVWDGTAWI